MAKYLGIEMQTLSNWQNEASEGKLKGTAEKEELPIQQDSKP